MANVFTITISAVDKATAVAQKVNASIAKITKPINDVKASVSAFAKETGLDKVGKGLEKVGGIATDAARKIASIAPPLAALAGAGTVAGLAALASSWGHSATEIANTSATIGVTTDQLQKYRGAARLAGLTSDDMTSSLKSVGSAFEDAAAGRNTFAAGVMADKGINIHRLADGSVDAVHAFNDVAAAAAKITNVQARGKFLDIFGMGGIQPMVGRVGALVTQFERLNAVMSPAQIAQGEQFNVSMVALDASVDKLKNSVGSALTPALTRLSDSMIPIANEYGPKIARWIDNIDWDKTGASIERFVDDLGGVKAIAAGIAAISLAGPIAGVVSLVANVSKLITMLGIVGVNTAAGGAIALTAGSYAAEKARDSALDSSIHQQAEESAASRDQRVAEAVAGGVATPDRQGPADGGLGGRAYRWVGNLFRGSAANNDQTADVVQRLRAMGWSPAQAAGITSNLFAESKFKADAVGDNGAAYGIGQWHQDRQDAFKKRFGTDIRNSTLDQQLQFVDYELRQGGEKKAGNALAQATTASDAGAVVSRMYERPADADGEAAYRGKDADNIDRAVNGTVHVKIDMPNAPPGAKATVTTTGKATASAKIGTSMLMDSAI
jgi:hypothetical protein